MASDDITFDVPAVEVTDEDEKAVDILIAQQSSQLLADALKRMDGLIGDYRYVRIDVCVCTTALNLKIIVAKSLVAPIGSCLTTTLSLLWDQIKKIFFLYSI